MTRTTAEITADITAAAWNVTAAWKEWTPRLRGAPIASGRPSGDGNSATILAVSCRREACEIVASWVLAVVDDLDLDVRVDGWDMPGMCSLIAEHAAWLSGQDAAEDLVAELADVAHRLDGLIPSGRSTRVRIGACPSCGAEVTGEPEWETVRCRQCDREGSWRQWEKWVVGRREWVTSTRLAEFIRETVGITVSGRTVHRWVADRKILPRGQARTAIGVGHGTPLFDPWDAVVVALAREVQTRIA